MLPYDPSFISPPEGATSSPSNDIKSDINDSYHRTVLAMAKREMEASENYWGRIAAAVTLAYDPVSKSFYTGNDLGVLRKFSLESLMNSLDQIECMAQDMNMTRSRHQMDLVGD